LGRLAAICGMACRLGFRAGRGAFFEGFFDIWAFPTANP
jgi:hypothetical protein